MTSPAPSGWNPDLYARFRAERSQPFYDLAALVQPRPGMRVVDLGCGSGELTAWLHAQLGAAETLGVDSSESMLAATGQHATPSLRFERADIAGFARPGAFDVVFSNAALQWVPDHPRLFAALAALLAPGGQLAVQVPRNWEHPSHVIAAALADEEPYASALGGVSTRPLGERVLRPEQYAELLFALGFREQHVRLQVYPHVLPDTDAVVEWVSGTLLTPYRARLAPALYQAFFDEYRARVFAALGDRRPHFYPYPRILAWARRD